MRKLNKAQIKTHDQLVNRLISGREEIDGLLEALNEAIVEYNGTLEEAKEFTEEVHEEMETYYEERSEGWQEDDRGQDYSDWMEKWDNFDPAHVDEVEIADFNDSDDLAELPLEVGG
jgi:hypothetical protein